MSTIASPPERSTRATRVLIADDDPNVRRMLRLLFRLQGHEVHCAADGLEALDVVRAQPPDVMVLDVEMPNADGLAVLRTLRESGLLDGLTVVMYTANSDESTLREATIF